MSKVLSLTKVLFKNSFVNIGKGRIRGNRNSGNSLLTILVVGIILLASYGWPMVMATTELITWISPAIDPSVLLELIVPAIVMMLLIISVMTIISYYYLSTDISILLPLPLKPSEILLARFIMVTVSLYFFEFLFFAPFIVGYGLGTSASVLFYVYGLIFLLTAPLVPVSIMSIVITSLMRIGNFTANKDLFTYIVLFLSLGMGVGISTLPNIIGFDIDPNNFAGIINEIGKITNYILPFLRPVIITLRDSGNLLNILWFLVYLAISVGAVYIFLLVSSKVYIKGVMIGGTAKKRKKVDNTNINESFKGGSAFKSYALKEWRLMTRTPVYNTNLILIEFIMMIVMGVTMIFGASAEGGSFAAIFSMIASIRIDSRFSYIIFIFLAGLMFLNGVSLISPSAISREGKTAYFLKYIPMSPLKQINAKIFFGIVIQLILPVLLLIASLIIGIINFLQFLYFLVPSVLITVFLNYWGILIDLVRPKLNWDDETVAVKQNFNGVIYMLICYALAFIFGGLGAAFVFIEPIRAYVNPLFTGIIALLGGFAILAVSLTVIFLFVKQTESLVKWAILLNVFTLFIILGGILTFAGIMEFAHLLSSINAGMGIWAIVISLVVGFATYIMVKSISSKGDAIFDKIS